MRSLLSGVAGQVEICKATPRIVSCENGPGIGIEQLMCSGMRDFVRHKWTDGPIYCNRAARPGSERNQLTTTISNIAISHVTHQLAAL